MSDEHTADDTDAPSEANEASNELEAAIGQSTRQIADLKRMSGGEPWAKVIANNAAMEKMVQEAYAPLRNASLHLTQLVEPALAQGISAAIAESLLPAIRTLQGVTDAQSHLQNALTPGLLNMIDGLRTYQQLSSQLVAGLNKPFSDLFLSLNVPTFATQTQSFLTSTDDLRYRRGTTWHYTDGYALMQILSRGHIWASAPEHLNDTAELRHGMDIITEEVHRYIASLDAEDEDAGWRERVQTVLTGVVDPSFVKMVMNEIFYISASKSQDSLTLWRNYAQGDGFAIGLAVKEPLAADGIVDDPDDDEVEAREDVPPLSGWFKIAYRPNDKQKLASEFVQSAVTDLEHTDEADTDDLLKELRKHVIILASTMKHQSFEDEKEVRWMTTNWTSLDVLHYENVGKRILPVLHVRTRAEDEEPLPIVGVRCSPLNPPSTVRTIKGLLVQKGYAQASENVVQSELPFRG